MQVDNYKNLIDEDFIYINVQGLLVFIKRIKK